MVADKIDHVTQASAEVGSDINIVVDGSKRLNQSIIDALTSGVGSHVNADTNQCSTHLAALQVQQHWAPQALSGANENSQTIMKLFGT